MAGILDAFFVTVGRALLVAGFALFAGGASAQEAQPSAPNPVVTSSNSNAFHVGDVHVNAPNATDSKGIADSIADALQLSLHASLADYGQA